MNFETLKIRLKKLPLAKKLILVGSFLAIICVFMPWYQDIDRFNTGDMFLGISGPLYLAGLIVFFSALISFGLIALELMDKPLPKLPITESYLHFFTSGVSILMLILTSSVYFHPKFGINLTDKTMGIGMILGFIGAALIIAGAIVALKKKEVSFETEGELKPLIEMDTKERVQKEIKETEQRPNNARDIVQESINELYKSRHDTNDIK